MELNTIRWRNARLIHKLSGLTLKEIAIRLERDPSMVAKWFAQKFKKNIGDASARLVEKTFIDIIITECRAMTALNWLDKRNEALWSSKLGIMSPQSVTLNVRREDDQFNRAELIRGIMPIFRKLETSCGIDSSRFLEFVLLNIELHSNNPDLQIMAASQILSFDDILQSPNNTPNTLGLIPIEDDTH